jgi:hypothetical protein
VVGVIVLLFIIGISTSHGGSSSTSTSTAPAASGAASAPAPSGGSSAVQQASGTYGTALTAGDLTVVVGAPQKETQAYLGTQYCSMVAYQNNGTTPASYNLFDWNFRNSGGAQSSASIAYSNSLGTPLNSGQLAPGGAVAGVVCSDTTVKDVAAVVYSPGFGIMHQLTWQ